MDIYNLINSKAIAEHCRKIQHKFNTEEIAVLIYRNKTMSVDEKIQAYQELIDNYEDMPMIEHLHCGPYESVKEEIRFEIKRLQGLCQKVEQTENDYFYTYRPAYNSLEIYEDYSINNNKKTYQDIMQKIENEIKEEDNEICKFQITKKSFETEETITAEFVVNGDKAVMTNIYDANSFAPDFSTIFVNMPTPFEKGDLLVSNVSTLKRGKNVFVLNWMITWREDLQARLDKGNCDSSDMYGNGYYIYEDDIIVEDLYDYDSWEYFSGELEGIEKILKGVSSLTKNEIGIDLFLQSYNKIKQKYMPNHLCYYTDEGLKLAGFNNDDIEQIKGEKTQYET